MIYFIAIFLYLIIGGTLHYFLTDEEDKTNYTAAFVWPLLVPLAIGEWIGQHIKRIFKL